MAPIEKKGGIDEGMGGDGTASRDSSGPPPHPILALQPSDTTYNAYGAVVVISYPEEGGGMK